MKRVVEWSFGWRLWWENWQIGPTLFVMPYGHDWLSVTVGFSFGPLHFWVERDQTTENTTEEEADYEVRREATIRRAIATYEAAKERLDTLRSTEPPMTR